MTAIKPFDHKRTIYSPAELGQAGKEGALKAAEHAQFGIELDIPGTVPAVKDYFAPLLPWEICALQAQTSNGKTMFTNWWLRQVAKQLARQGRDEIIIRVSHEETVEALAYNEFGRLLGANPADFARGTYTDMAKINWAVTQIDQTPVWTIGLSAARPENAPPLTLTNVYRAIRELVKGSVTGEPFKVALVLIDYLQAMPYDSEIKAAPHEQQRRLQVAKDVFNLRAMANHLQAPFVVNVQAKQELRGNNPPMDIPGTYDGMETSAIATRFDRILSLWMPKTTKTVGTTFTAGARTHKVEENQVFLKVNKQRGNLPAGLIWELKIDYVQQEYMDAYHKQEAQL